MGLVLSLVPAVFGFFLLLLFYPLFLLTKPKSKKNGAKEPPEPAGRLPIIGHLHTLWKREPLFHTLGALTDKHGPIFTIWIGVHRTIVVSSSELAKECLTTHDRILATRPDKAAGNYLGYGYSMFAFSKYGPYWRDIRKIITLELLSPRCLAALEHIRAREIDLSMRQLYREWVDNSQAPVLVEMRQWFGDLMFNNVVMTIAGKRYFGMNLREEDKEEARRFQEAIVCFHYLAGILLVSDAIPSLEWLDVGGHIAAMKKAAKDMDVIISAWVDEHRRSRSSGKAETHRDFIDVMLSISENSTDLGHEPDTAIKSTALALIVGGTETSTVALVWALSLLLNHPHVLVKAQNELDMHTGKNRNVDESDINNLPYLRAIIKETLRLYPSGPLAIPHQAMEDCNIAGFYIPKGTHVMFNLWKIQQDPQVWEDPMEFRPERFLGTHKEVDVRGQHFELIPFGSGRRICPAISFSLKVMHVTLARLLHGFEMRTLKGKAVDMSLASGLTIPKATPLEALFTVRQPSHLYE